MVALPTSGDLPAPEPAQRFHGALKRLGQPIADFVYRNAAGDEVMHVCRYKPKPDPTAPSESDTGIVTRWWTWNPDSHEWQMHRGAPDPSPLFQLDLLFGHPQLPVYVVDSEEAAQALQTLLSQTDSKALATTWAGGLSSYRKSDFSVLCDRDVTLWPASMPANQATIIQVAQALYRHMQGSGHELAVVRDTGKPPHWDVTAAISSGWNWESIQEYLITHTQAVHEQIPTAAASPEPVQVPETIEVHEPRLRDIGSNLSLGQKWREYGLATGNNGLPYPNLYNVVKVIEYHKGGYCDVWLDEFHNKLMTQAAGNPTPREWTDADTLEFTRFLQDPHGVGLPKISTHVVHEAAILCGSKKRRNEVREWLQSLQWDGVERLSMVLPNAWGTTASPYYRAVGRCFIMGAVRRIIDPGCQVDNLPVFEGVQGIRKTTSIMTLASEPWFDSPTYKLGDLDFYQCLPGKWFLEFAEMANFNGRLGNIVNAIVTRRKDTYRPSYGRISKTFARMCVFSATTNAYDWNTSDHGARRFWPVACGNIDSELIKELREQWFAEAMVRVERGEPWWDVPNEAAIAEQQLREPEDVWKNMISEYLDGREGGVTSEEILTHCLMISDRAKWDQRMKTRVASVMRQLGWGQTVKKLDGRSCRLWTALHRPRNPAPAQDSPSHDSE